MKKPAGKAKRKTVKLNIVFPENLQTHFVSNLIVQHEPENFILSFFETFPPLILGETEEDRQKSLDRIDRVESKCVARLVVTPERMESFVKAMSINLEQFGRQRKSEDSKP